MSSARGQRIEENCKIIWGSDCEYDLDIETDDYEHYACLVKKDFGHSFGPPLTITSCCDSDEAAWEELDRMLRLMAAQVKRGTPMSEEERLQIFGGSTGQHRWLLKRVTDAIEKSKTKAA